MNFTTSDTIKVFIRNILRKRNKGNKQLLTKNICSFSVVLLMNCLLFSYMLFQLFFQRVPTQPHASNR